MTSAGKLRNPLLEFAKTIHEAIGIENPRAFIALFAFCGLVLFAGLGWLVDKGYRTRMREQSRIASPATPQTPNLSQIPSSLAKLAPAGALSQYAPDVTIPGPDNVSIRIFQRNDLAIFTFANDGLSPTPKLRVETIDTRSFKMSELVFRNPEKFNVLLATVPPIRSGDITNNAFILFRRHPDRLEMGDRNMGEYLRWPTADPNTTERWMIGMKVYGLSREWTVLLDVRWERGTDRLDFREHRDDAPPDSY